MGELRFDGRVAVVTGAGRGIGAAHARLLAARGAAVVVNDIGFAEPGGGARSGEPASDVVRQIVEAGGRAAANAEDVSTKAGAERLVAQALDSFGRIDIVLNNAGVHDRGPFAELAEDALEFMMRNHVYTCVQTTQAAWPHLARQGYGRVVMTTSGAAFFGIANSASYCAAKGAVYGLMRAVALEGLPLGIQVNGFWPSAFTRMVGSDPALAERMARTMPPDLAAPVAVWLAHEGCPLNGEVLHGGSGRASRVFLGETRGLIRPGLTLEDVAAGQDQVTGEDGYFVFKTAFESSETQTKLLEAAMR